MTIAPSAVDAADESIDGVDTQVDAVVVRFGSGRFAVGLSEVAEVGKLPRITRVPGTPSWVAGVANWRGRILAVLDLRSLLGADASALDSAARLVVLATETVTAGVLVDAVEGAVTLGRTGDPVPAVLPVAGADLVCGQVPRDDGPLALLDVEAVMKLRETLRREVSWTSPSG